MLNIWTPGQLRCQYRSDAETALISQQLLYILPQVYDVQRLPLRARECIPVNRTVPRGASSFKAIVMEGVGSAGWMANDSDEVRQVNLKASDSVQGVAGFSNGWRLPLLTRRAADYAGVDLATKLAMFARQAMEEFLNTVAFSGDTTANIPGFLSTSSGVGSAAAVTGTWGSATPDQKLADVIDAVQEVETTSKGLHRANTLLLPLSTKKGLLEPRVNSDVTVLAWLRANMDGVEIKFLNELETSGTGGTKEMVAYEKSEMNVSLYIPDEFEVLPPEEKPLSLSFTNIMSTGGTIWHRPLAGARRYGL